MAKEKVFIDTNVMVDITAWRMPQYNDSVLLLNNAYKNKFSAYTSAISFVNAYYITAQLNKDGNTSKQLIEMKKIISVLNVTDKMIDDALFLRQKDFEDALIYVCAKHYKMNAIVTNNVKDFKKSDIPIYSPKEYLKVLNK